MSGTENKINKIATRVSVLEKKIKQNEFEENLENKNFEGNITVNLWGFQNIQISNSYETFIEDETSTIVIWEKPIIKNGVTFDGILNENFLINTVGKNVIYEFIITTNWEVENNGCRCITLEDPNGKMINSSFTPDNIPQDINKKHSHQVIFKQIATKIGGWKVRLYQNSGKRLTATVNIKVLGPFIY